MDRLGGFWGCSGLTLVVGALVYTVVRASSNTRRPRSMSFSSKAMVHEAFPAAAHVQPPVINILLYFKECPSKDKILECIKRLMVYDRFRCSPINNGKNGWEFIELENYDMSELITTINIDSEKDMMKEVDKICLDTTNYTKFGERPLWEFIRIVSKDGVSGVMLRVHHVIGDGISLIQTVHKLFYHENGDEFHIDISVGGGAKGSSKAAKQEMGLFGYISALISSFIEVLSLGSSAYDTDLPFSHTYSSNVGRSNVSMSRTRSTVVFPTLQLDFIKQIKNKAGVTLNDVVFSATSGAIKRYCEDNVKSKSEISKNILYRSLMPIAFPKRDGDSDNAHYALRNKWSFVSVKMPMGNDSNDRLKEANTITNLLKSSPTAGVQLWVQSNVLPLLPVFLQRQIAFDVFSRHSLVFSNLPGPPDKLKFCDRKLLGLQVIFPNIIPQALIISYGGCVFYNMSVDDSSMPNVKELLPKYYGEEMAALAKSFGVDTTNMFASTSSQGVFGIIN